MNNKLSNNATIFAATKRGATYRLSVAGIVGGTVKVENKGRDQVLLQTNANGSANFEAAFDQVALTLTGNTGQVTVGLIESLSDETLVQKADGAGDSTTAITWLDAGTTDQRISTMTTASASLGLSYVDTMTYAGFPGFYRLTNITRTIP